ncbi:MAG: acyl carrier protein [Myxococcota bacterium]|jgi:acyl carrier protein|nr:acyl carrier protein [Myxococcota bacterium]
MSSIAEKINTILAEEFELDEDVLQPGASIDEDLGLDSLDAVDLTVLLEEQTGVRVDPKRFIGLRTLGDIHGMVEKLVEEAN